jgi:hypothetical protein
MTLTVEHPRRYGWHHGRSVRTRVYHPAGVAAMALLVALLGAWAALVAFVGPDFGYRATETASWQWTTRNWLLHLVPGAMAFVAGVLAASMSRAAAPSSRGVVRFCALVMIVAGTWLVIGPALWPVFESGRPYADGTTAGMAFANQVGANLGPGLLIVALGAMILESVGGMRSTRQTVEEPLDPGPASPAGVAPAAPAGTAGASVNPAAHAATAPVAPAESTAPAQSAGPTKNAATAPAASTQSASATPDVG